MRSTTSTIAAGGLAIAVAVVWVFAFKTAAILFAGTLFALALHAIAAWLARSVHVPYHLALALVVVLGLSTTALVFVLFAPSAATEFRKLTEQLPAAFARATQRLPLSSIMGSSASSSAAPQALQSTLQNIAFAAVGNSVEAVAALLVVFFIGVYGAAQPGVYERAVLALVPQRERARAHAAVHSAADSLTRWLLGRCVAMLFVGVTTGIAFHLLHIPLAGALAIFAGLLTFIEYAGAVISAIPPVLLAFAQSPTVAISVLVLYTALHVIEGYVLTPLLARVSVRVPAAIGLGSQVLLGTLAGPLGLTFSTPLLVIVVSTVRAFREHSAQA
jgi:predicted PurR-regulated permease PerM